MNSKINSAACIENSNVCFFGCRLALEWLLLAEIIHGMREFPGGISERAIKFGGMVTRAACACRAPTFVDCSEDDGWAARV